MFEGSLQSVSDSQIANHRIDHLTRNDVTSELSSRSSRCFLTPQLLNEEGREPLQISPVPNIRYQHEGYDLLSFIRVGDCCVLL